MYKFPRRAAIKAAIASIATVPLAFVTRANAQATAAPNYMLQNMVDGLTIPDKVTVVGIGGFGSWPAYFCALCGVREMLLIDAGDVDEIDLARTPFRPKDVGMPKAEAMAALIAEYRPETKITVQKRFVEPTDEDIFFGQVLFDGTNYAPLSSALPAEAERRGVRFVHGFYNAHHVGVSSYFPESLKYRPGNEIPVWIGPSALSGLLAMYSAFSTPIEYFGDIRDISIGREKAADDISKFGLDLDK